MLSITPNITPITTNILIVIVIIFLIFLPSCFLIHIVLKETNEPIGSISVVRMDEETETFEIGYCLSYDYWNKGITSEAFKAVIKYAFEEIKIKVFAARHDERNIASGKVMEKCGLKYIGTKEDINKGEKIILKMYELKNN